MNILTAEKLTKSYSEKILLDGISLGIHEGDKIGLIGVNGTGKTTLLNILSGVEVPDSGHILKTNGLSIEYLPQNPIFENHTTVLQHIFNKDSELMALIRDYEVTLQQYNQNSTRDAGDQNVPLEKKLIHLSQRMDVMNAWTAENEIKSILTQLGIEDFTMSVQTLSGGQRKRVAMASALINPADLLILDEPTNHIDNSTVEWLEKYLSKQKGALVMVTHDRYFLDRVANKIIELDNGHLYTYQGNYSKFLELKAEREEMEQAVEKKQQSLYKSELEWIKKGAKARTTKQKARIDRFEKLEDSTKSEGRSSSATIEITAGAARLGKKIIELEHVGKTYPGKNLIEDFSYILLREDRVGIIGPNGSGKSTLLRMLASDMIPDTGKIIVGDTVKIGFFSQESTEMNEQLRLIEYIKEEAEILVTKDGTLTASQMLERFLFPPHLQWTPISKLSGGEKRRLYLLRILMSSPNVLLLDEPTNDLDIQTLTILENYLMVFPGAVMVVSHDRYFLDKVTNKIFSFEGNGYIRQVPGNYSDYEQWLVQNSVGKDSAPLLPEKTKSPDPPAGIKITPTKLSYKEQRDYEQIDDRISSIETQLKELEQKISLAASDYTLLQTLLAEKDTLEVVLDEAMTRWLYLNELVNEIERNKR